MKKLSFVILAALGAIATLGSCQKVLDQLANVPNFALADTLYNGQELKIQRIRAYTYSFESDSPVVTLDNRSGKDWYARFFFDEELQKEPVAVTITAHNMDKTEDGDGKPVDYKMNKTCTVFPWKINAYDVKDGEYAGCMLLRMTGVGKDDEFAVADTGDKIYTSWNSKGKLTWTAGSGAEIVKAENCDCYVRKTDSSCSVSARLGQVTRTIDL